MPIKTQRKDEPNIELTCACGCGGTLMKYDKYGRGRTFLPGHSRRGNAVRAFWSNVSKTQDCWIWLGATTTAGYGSLTYQMRRMYAHRLSYELVKGPITEGKHILHTCDNPICVNPDHLVLGTPLDNAHDKIRKGRQVGAKTTLTQENILEIFLMADSGLSQRQIANFVSVNPCHISRILSGKRRAV